MEQKTVHIPNISCGHCIMTIERVMGDLQGVKSVEGDVTNKSVTLKWEAPATWEEIARTLENAGYPAD